MTDDVLLGKLVALLRERRLPADTPLPELRLAMELAVAKTPLASNVSITQGQLGGRDCEWFIPAGVPPKKTILYFHGGGYVLGSLNSIRPLASYLASLTHTTVIALDYRLAPEHPFPHARTDAVNAYKALTGRHAVPPSTLVLAGDSAGGGLVLATLLALRDDGQPLPLAGVCLSPWTDLTLTAASLTQNADRDPQITHAGLRLMATHYLAGSNPQDPGVSPRFGSYHNIPPLLIHVGDAEGLLDDSRHVAKQAGNAGVVVTLDVWPNMIHVWHAFAPRLPQAMDALHAIGVWLDELTAPVT